MLLPSTLRCCLRSTVNTASPDNILEFTTFHHLAKVVDIFNWFSTERANIVAILDPSDDTLAMEIMSWVTLQLSELILWFVVHQTNFAGTFVFESLWVVLYTSELANNLRDLAIV